MPNNHPKLLLLSPWDPDPIKFSKFDYVTDRTDLEVLGVICIWQPDPILLKSKLPKIWYYSEPTNSPIYKTPLWEQCLNALKPHERLFHGHPSTHWRTPHITHVGSLTSLLTTSNRKSKAIAVVSNRGHRSPTKRSPQIALRNHFCTAPNVDLYGKKDAWGSYRSSTFSIPKSPNNYCGPIPGRWSEMQKTEKVSQYKVAICLENTLEPYYFTEKFVDAVRAGCIPIYNAHPTVASTVLEGAKWVDSNDFDNAQACVEFALKEDLSTYQKQNAAWLQNNAVHKTEKLTVYERLGNLLLSSKGI